MEKTRDIIGKYLPFAWWVFLALLMLSATICCIAQAAAKIGVFWAVCGSIGCGFALLIFAWQAFGEWTERNNYD